ncbi:acyl-CoA dehydrogenase family protein [Streptomyces sp. NPDC059002]|uniref:acyl-CoA dehydrogenase family protein n=1 Tax=Streptomyces sp. NPDC059002 TaxID=3346690 RepID=UPI00368660FA
MTTTTGTTTAATSSDGVLAAARRLADLLDGHAAEADRTGQLPPEVLKGLLDAGFARHFVPARHGGTEGTFTDLAHAVRDVGTGCVSTAWVALIYATAGRMAAFLPEAGQDELWAEGPDVAVASALRPSGSATLSGDTWTLTGRWDFLSGVDFAGWALLCVAGDACTGEPAQGVRYFAVPRDAWTVEQTWAPTGMRATASNSVHIDRVRVPRSRSFAHSRLLTGTDDPDAAACYRAPLQGSGPPLFVAPALGGAAQALTRWAERRTKRDDTARLALARGTAELDIAELLLDRSVAAADTPGMSRETVARVMRDAAVAARLVRDAVDRLVDLSGSAMLSEADPLQRAWRDVRTATAHGALDLDRSSTQYVRDVWGWTHD